MRRGRRDDAQSRALARSCDEQGRGEGGDNEEKGEKGGRGLEVGEKKSNEGENSYKGLVRAKGGG